MHAEFLLTLIFTIVELGLVDLSLKITVWSSLKSVIRLYSGFV
jgi:hypothetical protein